jgi:hypothetical protein
MRSCQKSIFLISLFVLSACTATYNWRELRFDDQGFVALFPSKTSSEQQNIRYLDQDLPMTMSAASTDDALFAVGSMPFDPKKLDGQEIIDWMQTNTSRLIQSQKPPIPILFEVKTAGSPSALIPATGFNLKGLGPDGNFRIYWVRWLKTASPQGKATIYQISAIKPFKTTPSLEDQKKLTEQFETFMQGFHPY